MPLETRSRPDLFDVLIVGGGVAGLSAALVLGRARRRVLVVDEGKPRNAPSAHVQGFLTRDGATPQELIRAARAEVEAYGVELRSGVVTTARRCEAGFEVELADGTTAVGRHLVLATGLRDKLPDLPGVQERWGKDVLHCPYCHGWEVRDRSIVLLGTRAHDAQEALLLRQWSEDVTLVLPDPGALPADEARRLAARGITTVAGEAAAVEVEHDALSGVRLQDGLLIPAGAVFLSPQPVRRSEVAEALQADGEGRHVDADECGRSSVPGLWVVGSVERPTDQVPDAISDGNRCAIAVNYELVMADADDAVRTQDGCKG